MWWSLGGIYIILAKWLGFFSPAWLAAWLPAYVASPGCMQHAWSRPPAVMTCTIRCLFSSNRPDKWNPVSCLRTLRCAALSETTSELIHDGPAPHNLTHLLPPNPVRLLDWLDPNLERKCANLQPDPGEGRSQEQALGPFTSRIHHQRWTRAHLG